MIPDAGHFVPEEQPEALAKALIAFSRRTVAGHPSVCFELDSFERSHRKGENRVHFAERGTARDS